MMQGYRTPARMIRHRRFDEVRAYASAPGKLDLRIERGKAMIVTTGGIARRPQNRCEGLAQHRAFGQVQQRFAIGIRMGDPAEWIDDHDRDWKRGEQFGEPRPPRIGHAA